MSKKEHIVYKSDGNKMPTRHLIAMQICLIEKKLQHHSCKREDSHFIVKELWRIFIMLCMLSSCSCSLLSNLMGSDSNTKDKHIIVNNNSNSQMNSNKPNIAKWKPTFDDGFNAPYLNTTMWNIQDDGALRYHNCCLSVGTGEQYFTSRALSLHNGILQIISNRESLGGKNYTSGAITTENKYSFLYGTVEIRARLPEGQGIWPALWMLTANASDEVDIMEMVGDADYVYQTYHENIPAYNSYEYQCAVRKAELPIAFHLYSLVWKASSITWYIDGEQTCQITKNIPRTPMYLLLDTAVGGDWPGLPDVSTVFPQYTDIDYVRVYQLPASVACTGLLVSTPLQLESTSIARGDMLMVRVVYTNWCTTPFTFNDLLIVARKPDGGNADFAHQARGTLQPGQSITIDASRVIQFRDPIGQWYAFSSFQTHDGKWHGDESNLEFFTVTG